MKRITTNEDRDAHVSNYLAKYPHLAKCEGHAEQVGDMASVNANMFHNPNTGFQEFFADTPEWIIEIARKNKWVTTKSETITPENRP